MRVEQAHPVPVGPRVRAVSGAVSDQASGGAGRARCRTKPFLDEEMPSRRVWRAVADGRRPTANSRTGPCFTVTPS